MAKGRRTPIGDVLSGRPVDFSRPLVLEIDDEHHDVPMRLAQPGTIALLVARKEGDPELRRIVDAIRDGDLRRADRVYTETLRDFGRSLLDPKHDVKSIDDIPVFSSFRYGRKTLRRGMCTTSGLQVARSLALYDGARLDPGEFQVVHHRKQGNKERVRSVVVVRKPRLTKLERTIIEKVPAESTEINFGEDVGMFVGVIVGAVAEEFAERAVNYTAQVLGIDKEIQAGQQAVANAKAEINDFVHEVADDFGIEGVINVAEAGFNAVDAVAGVGEAAVDYIVDGFVDAVGVIVDWVADAFADDADVQVEANAGADFQADADADADADAFEFAADDGADDDEGGDDFDIESGKLVGWDEELAKASDEIAGLAPAAAVRQLLALRAKVIAANRGGSRISLLGKSGPGPQG
jgi:hypothetical protein